MAPALPGAGLSANEVCCSCNDKHQRKKQKRDEKTCSGIGDIIRFRLDILLEFVHPNPSLFFDYMIISERFPPFWMELSFIDIRLRVTIRVRVHR
jgi:hypothetical protein